MLKVGFGRVSSSKTLEKKSKSTHQSAIFFRSASTILSDENDIQWFQEIWKFAFVCRFNETVPYLSLMTFITFTGMSLSCIVFDLTKVLISLRASSLMVTLKENLLPPILFESLWPCKTQEDMKISGKTCGCVFSHQFFLFFQFHAGVSPTMKHLIGVVVKGDTP